MSDPMIVAARRTPIATRGRALARFGVAELAAPVIRAVLADAATPAGEVADVVLGNCMGPGGNPGRIAALAAGLPPHVPGGTVDRQCGSGLAAIVDAAAAIRAGDRRVRVAGGVESASTAPTRSVDGVPYDRAPFAPAGFADPGMPRAADDLAAHDGISRARQDAHAARSHARATEAHRAGRFTAELVPLGESRRDSDMALRGSDTALRDGVTALRDSVPALRDDAIGGAAPILARLAPLFAGGTVTAGTATRVSDGAAAVLIAPADRRGDRPALAVRAASVVGCDPALPGVGAAPAVHDALARAALDVTDVAAFEIVEAFAAQSLAVLGRLGLADDDPRVCADGGALALGHPWGASGAVAVVRLFSRLVRGGAPAGAVGVAAASVGGGLGVALVVEVVR